MTVNSSFRDPSGYVFTREKEIYRSVSFDYRENYDFLINSGLYGKLVSLELLIPHIEVDDGLLDLQVYKILKPEKVPFISYPYEWCFSQLRDAAFLVLEIQRISLDYGMTLKDGNGYNVQFLKGKPIFIDTLSFEIYHHNDPWTGYKQFCQHFLAPLALMRFVDSRLISLLQVNLDGIPMDLAAALLPGRAFLRPGLLVHLKLHANLSRKYAGKDRKIDLKKKVSKKSNIALILFLESTIRSLRRSQSKTEWIDYYNTGILNNDYLRNKEDIVSEWSIGLKPGTTWDIGSNDGRFSRILSKVSPLVISMEYDYNCVESNYLWIRANEKKNILPLWIDITNPSPGIGWANMERKSLFSRDGNPDLILLLATIHHFVITFNINFSLLADWLVTKCTWLIIEFVPKTDIKVQRLLLNRKDIFIDYDQATFESVFSKNFEIKLKQTIHASDRVIYLMKARKSESS